MSPEQIFGNIARHMEAGPPCPSSLMLIKQHSPHPAADYEAQAAQEAAQMQVESRIGWCSGRSLRAAALLFARLLILRRCCLLWPHVYHHAFRQAI
jgi:hypothetical protein